MTIYQEGRSDPSTDLSTEIQFVTPGGTGNSATITFDADFTSKPYVGPVPVADAVKTITILQSETYDTDEVHIKAENQYEVPILIMGPTE